LLQDNSGLRVAKTLLPTDIKNLTEVLGTSTAGDNQFVNSLKPPDQRAPAFHLLSAQLIPVNGKTVLEVRGHFFDQSGAKGKEYGGIFVSSGADGTSIRELFLQADDLSTFSKHEMEYRRAVQSIKW
jgi:hypothetical protein